MSSSETPSGQISRYRLIDFSRSLAAIAVLALHYKGFIIDADWGDAFPGGTYHAPLLRIMQPIYIHGEYAVQFFWMISGFIFGFVYHKQNISIWNFTVRRFARLYPLHFITLLIVATLQALLFLQISTTLFFANNDLYHFMLNVFFVSGWGFEEGLSFNGPIWSVSVELIIYACFWVFIAFVPLRLIGAIVLMLAFTLLARATVVPLIAYCGSMFFLGTVIFFISQRMNTRTFLFSSLGAVAFAAAALALVPQAAASETVFLALTFGPALALIAALDRSVSDRFIVIDWAAAFGNLSFSIYLLHVPLILITVNSFLFLDLNRAFLSENTLAMIVFIGVTLALAHFSTNCFEHPVRRYFQRALSR